MRAAQIVTNLRCNQNCAFCIHRSASDDPRFIRRDAVEARIDAAIADGATQLTLTGGEPTLRRDLAELVAHARRRGAASIVLETNATTLDIARAHELATAGVSLARVHLAAWGDRADGLTRDPGGFARAVDGLRALSTAGVPIEVQTTLARSNADALDALPGAIADSLPRGVVSSLRVNVALNTPAGDGIASAREATEVLERMDRAARRVGIPVRLGPDGPPPCAFESPLRAANLFSLTPGGARREGYDKQPACAQCAVADRCPGVAKAYTADVSPFEVRPIADERTRRRLSVIDSVERQIEREFVMVNRTVDSAGAVLFEHLVRVNFHCNQSCRFCFVSTHLPSAGDAAVERAIDAAALAGARIVLTGGEPTLHPRLADFVRRAREASSIPVGIQTNATRLSQPVVDALVEAGLHDAFVSLHAADAARSDAITGAPGTFAQTVEGLDRLHASPLEIVVNFVVTAENVADMVPVVHLVAARWPRASLSFSFVAPSSDLVPRDPAFIPRYADVLPELSRALDEANTRGLRVNAFDGMCGLPWCVVPDAMRVERGAEPEIPDGFDGGEFVHPPVCERCRHARHCYGVRRGYLALHGDGELRTM